LNKNTIPIPISMLEVGKPLPVDVWSGATGQLLLRKGQPILSVPHRDKLHAHEACSTAVEGMAWQQAYERMVHQMLRDGVDILTIANAPMPSAILERDYVVGQQFNGGWLDLQEVLRGVLYQGGLSINPLPRLAGLERKCQSLLAADTDDSLFCLFQALADSSLGYCATNALLCAVVCELAGQKLGMDPLQRQTLRRAALTMNMGMAREQDSLSRQSEPLTPEQHTLIADHPLRSVDMLVGLELDDEDVLDIVRWHHAPQSPKAMARNFASRRLLNLADGFVARMAARKTRMSFAPVKAVKSMVMGAEGEVVGVSSAIAQAVGFYPPGSYMQLANGETAVSVQRGERANTPWVVPILDKDGMPIAKYVGHNTATEPAYAITGAVNFEKVRVTVHGDKVRQARERIPRA
jgi:hypothetical protein